MSEWQELTLSQITEPVKNTYLPKGDEKLAYIGLEHIEQETLRLTGVGTSSDVTSNKFKFEANDVLFGKLRPYFRKVYKPKFSGICSTDIWVFRAKKGFVQEYLFYFLASWDFVDTANSGEGGTRMPRADWNFLKTTSWLVPCEEEQKAIASILRSFDEKIDLLHRQNTTLERMAETLFRQWFVEEAQENWEEVTLESLSSRITDGSHTSPPNVEFGLPMASVKDMYQWGIDTSTCRHISKENFDELVRMDCRPLKNDILIAKDGSYLKHVFVAESDLDVVILSSIAIIRPNNKYHPLLLATFLKLDSTKVAMENIVTGAVIPRIVLKDFRKFPITLPPIELQDKAVKVIAPIYAKCWENNRQIQILKKLRDSLLPKLTSGEIRVI